jgi:hypothetical protein
MKKFVFVFCAVLAVLLMVSCSTAGTVWDDTVPLEQSAKIVFSFYEPTSYNSIAVNKKDFRLVTIPAGNATFTGDVAWFWYAGNVRYNFEAKDAVFSCKVEGGEEYWAVVGYKYDEDAKQKIWGIHLYNDVIKVRVGFPGEDKLVGFIPFNPPVISN